MKNTCLSAYGSIAPSGSWRRDGCRKDSGRVGLSVDKAATPQPMNAPKTDLSATKGLPRLLGKKVMWLMLMAVFIICVSLLFIPHVQEMECKSGGTSFGADPMIVFKCTQPDFFISCDPRTLKRLEGWISCSSFDGERYRLHGSFDLSSS